MSSNAIDDTDLTAAQDRGPGALLRGAREAQGLVVADVARQLKLSVHQVEALEAGDFQRLPGSVFVRGFLRNYARLLKLDVEPLLRSVAETLPREAPRPAAPPSQDIPFPGVAPRRWRAYAAAAAVIVAALAFHEFVLDAPETGAGRPSAPEPAQRSAPTQAGAPVPEAPAPPVQPGPPEAAPVAAGAAQGGPLAAPDAGEARASLAHGTSGEEDPAPGPGERQVRMVFNAESWVEIRDRSGRPIFSQLNRAGTEQRVNGRPPLAVIVGNAHGVRLTYDERPVNLSLYTKIDVARLTLE